MECLVWQPRVFHSALHGEGGPCCFRREASEARYALLLLGMPAGLFADSVTRERSSAPSSHQSVKYPSGETFRENDGLFGIGKKHVDGRHRRVSAVAVVQGRTLWDPEGADIATFHNPFSARPWPKDVFPSTRDYGPVDVSDESVRVDWR